MKPVYQKTVSTKNGDKIIKVFACDIRSIDEKLDILTVSAFFASYAPTNGTMMCALCDVGISVDDLSRDPLIDLRDVGNIWLSKETPPGSPIGRIGCIEMSSYKYRNEWQNRKTDILSSIRAYFRLLDIAALSGVKAETIGLPILGTGNQHIGVELILIPLINECVNYLKQNEQSREIWLIERNPEKADKLIDALENSYAFQKEESRRDAAAPEQKRRGFISYSSADKNIADNLCAKLENAGVKVWYAPRDIPPKTDYAGSIVNAISGCEYFILILSKNSLQSNHVLNEIDLAFQEMNLRKLKFCPLKIDEEELGPSFRYYLSRQHWMDAQEPPIEKRLDEFVSEILTK